MNIVCKGRRRRQRYSRRRCKQEETLKLLVELKEEDNLRCDMDEKNKVN